MATTNNALSNPLWEGAQLNVVPLAELPRLVRATLWIPGLPVDALTWRVRINGPTLKNGVFFITRPNPRMPLQATSLCLVLGWMRPK